MFLFATIFGGHDHSDMGHDFGGHDVAHDTGPSFLSAFSLAFFLTGFGGAGALAMASGWQAIPSTLTAVVSGSCLWLLAFAFMNMLHRQQADSTVTSEKLVGSIGVVTVAVSPESHLGKIRCANCSEELIVRCDQEIDAGERVVIVESAGGIYLVRKWDGKEMGRLVQPR
jgi:membrane protein implicated in regulation of membrane protease activity